MTTLYSILLFIRALGRDVALSTLRYSRLKKRLDGQYSAAIQRATPLTPGRILSHQQIGNTLAVHFERADLEITFLAGDLARLTWQPGKLPVSYAIAMEDWPDPAPQFQATDKGLEFSTPDCSLQVKLDGAIEFYNPAGQLLRSERPPSFFTTHGAFPHQNQFCWTSQADLSDGETLCGLGEHNGALNLRGQSHSLWNSDPGGSHGPDSDPLYMPLPVYLSLRPAGSYLIFFENSFRARFDFAPPAASGAQPSGGLSTTPGAPVTQTSGSPSESPLQLATATFEGGALRYYLIAGLPAQALERFTRLTGRPELPPRWSLGYQQCRWGYKTEQDVRQVVAGFSEHQMPLAAIHLDIDYMDGYRVFTVNPERFPDLAGLAGDLHQRGVRLVTIIDPGVKKDERYPLYQAGVKHGLFTGLPGNRPLTGVVWPADAAFPDFTHPDTRRWWGEQYKTLLAAGVDGIWHDMNEPASFTLGVDSTLPLAAEHHLDGVPGDHLEAHNLYGLQMNRAASDGLRTLAPHHRPWIVSRSGWVGNARYAWNWTADVETSWAGLRQTVTTLIGLGISAIPFTGSDIGGFTGEPSPELYIRWLQAALGSAFMRTHSAIGVAGREPWVFGEPYTTIIRAVLQFRSRLLPYLYTVAWQAATHGWPVMRPLLWDNPHDQDLWAVEDAFLLGDDLLAAPALEAQAQTRTVRFPGGSWFDFWDNQILPGGQTHTIATSLEKIPLFVRANRLLSLAGADGLELHLYTTGLDLPEGAPLLAGQLYDDSGDGYGPSRLDRFFLHKTGSQVQLTLQSAGEYTSANGAITLALHGCRARAIVVDGVPLEQPAPLQLIKPFQTLSFEVEA